MTAAGSAARSAPRSDAAAAPPSRRRTFLADLTASFVVFLVAVPLCVGVAVASGVPAELGLVTGIVGGLVTGFLPGSSLQVSGPAAGLTVLVYQAVQEFGVSVLGVLVLATGLLQLLMGALRVGRWFRAISVAVVEGMLAGIGLVLIAGQLYSMAGMDAPGTSLAKIAGLPGMLVDVWGSTAALTSFALGLGTIAVLVLWARMPRRLRVVPAPLVAVGLAIVAGAFLGPSVAKVEVHGLLDSIQPPGPDDFARLAELGVLGTILAFALIASAESLFSAAAVDRLHDGPRTRYNQELIAQGAGNAVCGVLGALPLTAVIVRSAANVQAGARTKASRVLHGVWLLLFAALVPAALGLIPVAALAGVLVHAGFKLVPLAEIRRLWRGHRGEALVLTATALAIVSVGMFEGVLAGLALSVVKTAWDTSRVHLDVTDPGTGPLTVRLSGSATFLRLPKLLDQLEALPQDRPVQVDLADLHHLDHACRSSLENWAARHSAETVEPVRFAQRL